MQVAVLPAQMEKCIALIANAGRLAFDSLYVSSDYSLFLGGGGGRIWPPCFIRKIQKEVWNVDSAGDLPLNTTWEILEPDVAAA